MFAFSCSLNPILAHPESNDSVNNPLTTQERKAIYFMDHIDLESVHSTWIKNESVDEFMGLFDTESCGSCKISFYWMNKTESKVRRSIATMDDRIHGVHVWTAVSAA